jgi:toxin ParE1/3/4
MGRPGRINGTRDSVIHATPNIAAYQISNQSIQILALLHSVLRWPVYL